MGEPYPEWRRAFARQAKADWDTYAVLARHADTPRSQWLHFLQMACEKLVKAHRCARGEDPENLRHSHKGVAKHLPIIYLDKIAKRTRGQSTVPLRESEGVRAFAREIELLHPSIDTQRRPDNCEYPWSWSVEGEKVVAPADYGFPSIMAMLSQGDRRGERILRIVSRAIEDLLT